MRRRRPVLVLGVPRSGSTWVSAVLASGPRTERRHELMTQGLLRCAGDAFRHLPAGARDADVERMADVAFAPSRRRVVVKEVLPLLGSWLVDRHDPLVVDLERHPVAVAESHLRLGWDPAPRERDRLPDGEATERLRASWDDLDPIQRKVAYVAAVRAHVEDTWGSGARHVRYEDLRADPAVGFEWLRTELGLAPVRLDVRDEAPSTGPYALAATRAVYPPAGATPAVREVWESFSPRSYLADADWSAV